MASYSTIEVGNFILYGIIEGGLKTLGAAYQKAVTELEFENGRIPTFAEVMDYFKERVAELDSIRLTGCFSVAEQDELSYLHEIIAMKG